MTRTWPIVLTHALTLTAMVVQASVTSTAALVSLVARTTLELVTARPQVARQTTVHTHPTLPTSLTRGLTQTATAKAQCNVRCPAPVLVVTQNLVDTAPPAPQITVLTAATLATLLIHVSTRTVTDDQVSAPTLAMAKDTRQDTVKVNKDMASNRVVMARRAATVSRAVSLETASTFLMTSVVTDLRTVLLVLTPTI